MGSTCGSSTTHLIELINTLFAFHNVKRFATNINKIIQYQESILMYRKHKGKYPSSFP